MNGDTAVLMIKALDGLSTRAVITAENIANAGTPGYRPLRVNFEQALQIAAEQGVDAVRQLQPAAVRSGPKEPELRTDLELATANTTMLRYSALIEVLSRQCQIESLAITGNN